MRVAILNDIGQVVYHVGDEAMCHAAVAAVTGRGITDLVLLTRDVHDTLSRYPGVQAAPTLTFPHPEDQRAQRLAEVDRLLSTYPNGRQGGAGHPEPTPDEVSDPVFDLMETIRGVDAVLVAGGGNMNSDYGWLLYERAVVARVAALMRKPVVFSGQTLGPTLTPQDRDLLRDTLQRATLVGLRDPESLVLAQQLCPEHRGVRRCDDDATAWAVDAVGALQPVTDSEPTNPASPRIVATFAPAAGAFDPSEAAEAYAAVLDALVHRTGGVVEFVPHMAQVDAHDVDEEFHRMVAARMHHESVARHISIEPAETALRRTVTADYVVTSRYHPVVFGLAGAATVLPIAVDRFSEVRMQGACATWGIRDQVMPLAALLTPRSHAWDLREAAQVWTQEMVEQHAEFSQELPARCPAVRRRAESWWDAVVVALTGSVPTLPEPVEVPAVDAGSRIVPALRQDWTRPQTPVVWNQHATVAIVIRTKNRAVLLERALDDVLAQSFADWRVVVVNDGGDPEPVDALVAAREREFAGRISVIHNRRSVGMEAASNIGLRATDSQFVCVHDDDDLWHPLFLQRTVAYLERPSCTDGGVMVRTEIVYESVDLSADPPVIQETGREIFWPDLESITLADLVAINRGVPISFLYRRRVHQVIGEYDETLPAVGDWEFHLRFAQAESIGFIADPPLAYWQQRPKQQGELGNSLHAAAQLHQAYDLVVRERYFQEWTRENGVGLPLYMAREFYVLQERLEKLEQQNIELMALLRAQQQELHHVANVVADNSFFGFLKRKLRKFFGIR